VHTEADPGEVLLDLPDVVVPRALLAMAEVVSVRVDELGRAVEPELAEFPVVLRAARAAPAPALELLGDGLV
jgi:hypothetical protein